MRNNAGFTLIEILISVVLSSLLLGALFTAFQGILMSQVRLSGSISIQRNLFYLNEKLSSLIREGGTIDYEEYFNRRILGYDTSLTEEGWTYSTESKYWNGDNPNGRPTLYNCGVESGEESEWCLKENAVTKAEGTWPQTFDKSLMDKNMGYGQYSVLWYNSSSLSGFPTPMKLPPIFPLIGTDLREKWISDLYLIKKLPDRSFERTYFRHILVQNPESDTPLCDPKTGKWCQWKIQMTRLISCDTLPSGGDGTIDAWVPHTDFWWGKNPCEVIDDGGDIANAADLLIWSDLSSPEINVIEVRFLPTPLKIPEKMAWAGEEALSPMIQMHLEIQLSPRTLSRGLIQESENTTRFLTTSFDLDTL